MSDVFGSPGANVDFDAVIQTAEDVFDAAEATGDSDGPLEVDLTGSVADAAAGLEGDASGVGDEDVDELGVQPGADDEDDSAGQERGVDGGDESDATAGEEDGSGGEAAAELHFANQQVAEASYREAREALNRELYQRQQLEARLAALEGLRNEPAVVPVNPQEDPVAAHEQAVVAGNYDQANAIVAEIQSAATNMAALARLAEENGNEGESQLYASRAQNAAALAENLRWQAAQAYHNNGLEQQLAPLYEEQFNRDLASAAGAAFRAPEFQGYEISEEQYSQIGRLVRADERYLGDGTVGAMTNGWRVAAQQVLFGGQQGMIDHLVSQKVQAEVQKALGNRQPAGQPAAPRRANRAAAPAGRGAPTTRKLSADEQEAADLQDFESNIPGRSEGMGILFNR